MSAFDGKKLYPHQEEAIKLIIESIHHGNKRNIIQMATGTGKTITYIYILKYLLEHKIANKVLILAPVRAVIEQIKHILSEEHFGISCCSHFRDYHNEQAIMTTYNDFLSKTSAAEFRKIDLIICDSADAFINNDKYVSFLNQYKGNFIGIVSTDTEATKILEGLSESTLTYKYAVLDAVQAGYLNPIPEFVFVEGFGKKIISLLGL